MLIANEKCLNGDNVCDQVRLEVFQYCILLYLIMRLLLTLLLVVSCMSWSLHYVSIQDKTHSLGLMSTYRGLALPGGGDHRWPPWNRIYIYRSILLLPLISLPQKYCIFSYFYPTFTRYWTQKTHIHSCGSSSHPIRNQIRINNDRWLILLMMCSIQFTAYWILIFIIFFLQEFEQLIFHISIVFLRIQMPWFSIK